MACYASDKFDEIKENDGDVAIIAKYDDAKKILKELLCIGYDVISLDIHEPEWENYTDEYSVTICDRGIWCEKAKYEGDKYFDEVADVVYVLDNCSSAILKKIETKFVYEVSVGEDDDSECDGDCDNCDLHETESDDIPGFSYSFDNAMGSTHISFYSTDKDLVEKMAKLYME